MNYGIYYFEKLTPLQQERYKVNCNGKRLTFHKIMHEHKWNSLAQMLMGSFTWKETPEKEDYWSRIAHS